MRKCDLSDDGGEVKPVMGYQRFGVLASDGEDSEDEENPSGASGLPVMVGPTVTRDGGEVEEKQLVDQAPSRSASEQWSSNSSGIGMSGLMHKQWSTGKSGEKENYEC
jgi:hypothetical protein